MTLTWTSAAEELFLTLTAGNTKSTSTLVRGVQQIGRIWAFDSVEHGASLRSGIGPDGSPIEISFRVERTGSWAVRFIADPCPPGAPLTSTQDCKVRAICFVHDWSGEVAARIASQALTLLADEPASNFQSSFLLWLGLGIHELNKSVETKLYINPWIGSGPWRGMPCAYEIFKLIGAEAHFLAIVRNLLALGFDLYPGIVGLNLSTTGARAAKLYCAARRLSMDQIQAVLTVTSKFQAKAVVDALRYSTQDVAGEVHFSILGKSSAPSLGLRASLFCPHWFTSDADVITVANRWLGSGCSTLDRLWKFAQGIGEMRFNFLTLEDNGVTVYLKAARFLSSMGTLADTK